MSQRKTYNDLVPPLHLTTTFKEVENLGEYDFVYSRDDNGNVHGVEQQLCKILEGDCITYSSGMASIVALLIYLKPKRVFMVPGYFGTTEAIRMLSELSPIELIELPRPSPIISNSKPPKLQNLAEIDSRDLLWLETPLNPTGEILDIEKYTQLVYDMTGSKNKITTVCDATIAPPPMFTPLKFGVDYAVYSATKILGGHSDLLSGIITTHNKEAMKKLREQRINLGSVMGNMEAWLLSRSLRTFSLRMDQQSRTCCALVKWLSSNPSELPSGVIDKIYHSSNQSDLTAKAQEPYQGHCSIFSIMFHSRHYARRAPFLLTTFSAATSIGGDHSLMEWRHGCDPTMDPRLCRVSIGLEPLSELQDDLIAMAQGLLKENPQQ